MRIEEGFKPAPFTESHPYFSDPALSGLLKRLCPPGVFQDVELDLERFGEIVLTTMKALSKVSARPQFVQYDQWGQRVDELQTSEGWRGLKALFQQEGIVGIFYERKHREHSRVHGFAKILLAVGDSHSIDCPLSMTDGAARVIELIGTPALKQDVFSRLINRDPSLAFTAGQWMTERPGGSDISRTETTAASVMDSAPLPSHTYGPRYRLDGFKWFSSATDSDVSLALARTGTVAEGTRGLSLFLVPLRLPLLRQPGTPQPSPVSNHIYVHRLKNKIGTQTLPTAELSLQGSEGYILGTPGQGVKLITPVLNITRLHSATASVGHLRRCLAIATSYSTVRAIKGGQQLLKDNPLHVAELAKASVLYRALLHMLFGTIALLGKAECGVATKEEELRLRLLTPAVKAFAADKAATAMEECMTALGGAGYMTENEFGRMIQDALVEKIWEGTITVLSLDLVRAVSQSTALDAFISWAQKLLASCPTSLDTSLTVPLATLRTAISDVKEAFVAPIPALIPRPALLLFSHVACGLFLLEHAVWAFEAKEQTCDVDAEVFRRWVEEGGLSMAMADVRRAKAAPSDRLRVDGDLVYGTKAGHHPQRARL
ncbi:uncharacterized protein LAESUDRAFT_722826 [Laetiporus sulphureus 93-53]|uniref:Acyl-CoA dehydrogenase NM domain-like protein n=1 Tax=Laetiporus sulphureus 93-53 TaxID=1314785 RepID=A0A165FKU9_9APHY|nr:uncharacterized protein LAESUDRAFT_722826 [Laetiporus sulphureus 93-53]KZT09123.1 hypothetical protein LAESUDRAFT_722826 [Laetiporus sulphureus 93-53]